MSMARENGLCVGSSDRGYLSSDSTALTEEGKASSVTKPTKSHRVESRTIMAE